MEGGDRARRTGGACKRKRKLSYLRVFPDVRPRSHSAIVLLERHLVLLMTFSALLKPTRIVL